MIHTLYSLVPVTKKKKLEEIFDDIICNQNNLNSHFTRCRLEWATSGEKWAENWAWEPNTPSAVRTREERGQLEEGVAESWRIFDLGVGGEER